MDEVEAIQKTSSQAIQPQLWKSYKFETRLKEKITILENQYSFMKF
jgi:hypothetical protein